MSVVLIASLGLGCGDDADSDSGASTGAESTGSADSTGGDSTSAGTDAGTEDATTAADASTDSGTGESTGSDAETAADSTTGDTSGFERFVLNSGAGPCPPDSDCDGFVELLAPGTLRVEVFGDVSKDVVQVEISEEDYDAAVAVFTDPALLALLDGAQPICRPPTDVFESMTVEIEGTTHEAMTTACDQAPIAAARSTAAALQTEYVP